MKFISYTYPWLENILKKELEQRKIDIFEIWPWFVKFLWDESILVKTNLWLRTANKVYLILDEQKVKTFDELFQIVTSINWKKYIPKWFSISIKPHVIKSKLHHLPSIQKITHKAIIKKLVWNKKYLSWEKQIEIRIDIFKDNLLILLDTSWEPLYKRWYRKNIAKAWLKETLAAWIILLSKCKSEICFDPFCWSWTLLIEKALIDLNIAPWSFRNFLFEEFSWIDKNLIEKEKWRAKTRIKEKKLSSFASDIDKNMVEIAKENIKSAWLEKYIKVEQKDFLKTEIKECIITNPPYNKRIKIQNIEEIYQKLYKDMKNCKCAGLITWYEDIDKTFYDFKVRVLSNGWDKVKFFYK